MWLLCSPASSRLRNLPHAPSFISSTRSLNQFRKARKPLAAGSATNCLSCPVEKSCLYSAKSIYADNLLSHPDNLDWPLKTVVPEIEDLYLNGGKPAAEKRLLEVLAEDYTRDTPDWEVKQRSWYGRCVWDGDNNVCDDQVVTITWADDPLPSPKVKSGDEESGVHGLAGSEVGVLDGRAAKTAIFYMIAATEKICERRGKIYGTTGEITYDSKTISVHSFASGGTVEYPTKVAGKGQGGGDESMVEKFCRAVQAAVSGDMEALAAQRLWLGCEVEEIVRSHVAVFAAEKARKERVSVDWQKFWHDEVEVKLLA